MSGGRNLLLLGGRGRMASMFRPRWEAAGHMPRVLDLEAGAGGFSPPSADALARFVPEADAVILCVPWTALADSAARAARFMRPDQVLLDICSVKVLPMRRMEEAFSGPVVGTHPLFGPEPGPNDTRVALTRGRNAGDEHAALAEALFRSIGCEPFFCTPEEHDAATATIQSLNFANSAAYFAALSDPADLERFMTPSFGRQLEASRKMLTQDAAMFCEFTLANPFFADALRNYQARMALAEAGDLAAVSREAAAWFAAQEARAAAKRIDNP